MPEEVRADLLLGRDTLSPGLLKAGQAASDASSNIRQLTRDLYQVNKQRATPVVDLNDAGATAKLKDVAQKLRDLDARVADPKIKADDKAAAAAVAGMRVKLDALGRKVASPRITLEGLGRAEAGILALDAQFGKLGGQGGGGGLLGLLTKQVTAFGTALPWPALAAMAGAAAALALALAPLAAALIPITIGFTGLAFVAKSALTPVFTALGESGKKLTATLQAMSPAQRAAYHEAEPLKDAFAGLAKAVQPEIMKAFGEAVKIVKELMPALKPLVEAAAKAVDAFLKSMADWLKSPSGQAFVNWLRTQGPKDIIAFGKFMWNTAHAVGDALNFIYNWGKFVDGFFKNLFTVWIPKSADILVNSIKVNFDEIQIAALHTLLVITEGFGHLPGSMGEPFRLASQIIRAQLNTAEGDVHRALGNIQNDINALHGKHVIIGFGLSGSAAGEGNLGHFAAGTGGAAPGWAWVGERGPELVRMRGGETVIPSHVARGYAGGTGFGFGDTFSPSPGTFDRLLNAAAARVENTLANFVRRKFASGGGAGGASASGGGAIEALARRMFPWPSYMWTDYTLVENREAGWNMFARNPSSGAYGLAQFINGPSEYFQWGGNPYTAAGQLTGMFNYIRARYNNPLNAWGHELNYGWYDRGGALAPGWNMAYNGTGRPEMVLPSHGGGGAQVVIEVRGNDSETSQFLVRLLKRHVRIAGGGNVQTAFATSR